MKLYYLLIPVFVVACSNPKEKITEQVSDPLIEATSFSGKPLKRKYASPGAIQKSDSALTILLAKSNLTEEDYIEAGRLHNNVNRFREAIEVYSRGLEKYPNSFRLLRHRGHRYLSTRQPDKAIIDLRKGDELIGDDTSILEYNASGYATGSVKYWIWYHIGLYHQWKGEYQEAMNAFQNCLGMAIDSKNQVGSRSWLFEIYHKLGQTKQANAIVAQITPSYQVDPEYSYFKKILLYKGYVGPEELLEIQVPPSEWTGTHIARAYGVAFWYSINEREEEALKIYHQILEAPHWNTWAYAMTDYEVNVARKN